MIRTAFCIIAGNCATLTFVALGCLISLRVGVFNLAVESALLSSALTFALFISWGHSLVLSIAAAALFGVLISAVFAALTVLLGLEEIVSGIAVNLFTVGATSLVAWNEVGAKQVLIGEPLGRIPLWEAPLILILLGVLSFMMIVYILNLSIYAPRLQAIKENRKAAKSCDLPSTEYRFVLVVLGGLFASIGGVARCLHDRSFTVDEWTTGMGYLALGLVFASQGQIIWSILACLAYSIVAYLQVSLGSIRWMPHLILDTLPPMVVILWFCGFEYFSRRKRTRTRPTPTTGAAARV
jgi:simple sugar transport system permease protein